MNFSFEHRKQNIFNILKKTTFAVYINPTLAYELEFKPILIVLRRFKSINYITYNF